MSETSIFGDLDLTAAADDPFKVENGTYFAVVKEAEVKLSQKGNKGLSITYLIDGNGNDGDGKTVKEWKNIPSAEEAAADENGGTAEGRRAASFLKQRLLSLGVEPENVNKVKVSELVGTKVVVTVGENDKGYSSINKVELQAVDTNSSANPFA